MVILASVEPLKSSILQPLTLYHSLRNNTKPIPSSNQLFHKKSFLSNPLPVQGMLVQASRQPQHTTTDDHDIPGLKRLSDRMTKSSGNGSSKLDSVKSNMPPPASGMIMSAERKAAIQVCACFACFFYIICAKIYRNLQKFFWKFILLTVYVQI